MYPYPSYNFGQQQQPSFQQNPIMGQVQQMGMMPQMPSFMGQNFMQRLQGYGINPPDPTAQGPQMQHGNHGGGLGAFGPMFGLAGMMAGHGGLRQMAPLLGGLAGFGLSKSGLFK